MFLIIATVIFFFINIFDQNFSDTEKWMKIIEIIEKVKISKILFNCIKIIILV